MRTAEEEAEYQALLAKARGATSEPAVSGRTPEEEAEYQALVARSRTPIKDKDLGSPVRPVTAAGQIQIDNKQQQLEARAKFNEVPVQDQFSAEIGRSVTAPEPKPLTKERGFIGTVRDNFVEEVTQAGAKLRTDNDGSSALRAIPKLFMNPIVTNTISGAEGVKRQANDISDLGSTIAGVAQGAFAGPKALADAVGQKIVGDPLRERDALPSGKFKSLGVSDPFDRKLGIDDGSTGEITPEQNESLAGFTESLVSLGVETGTPLALPRVAKGIANLAEKAKKSPTLQNVLETAASKNPLMPPREGDFDKVLTDDFFKSLTDDAQKVMKAAPDDTRKLYLKMADGLADKRIAPDQVQGFLQKNDMDIDTFVDVFKSTASAHGRGLARLSHVQRALGKSFEKDFPEAAARLIKDADDNSTWGSRLWAAVLEADTVRRLAGTSQLKTAVRNVAVSYPTMIIGAIDRSLETMMYGGFTKDSFSDATKAFGQFIQAHKQLAPKTGTKLMDKLDEVNPAALGTRKEELVGTVGIADATIGTNSARAKAGEAIAAAKSGDALGAAKKTGQAADDVLKRGLSVFNRAQEAPTRRMALALRLMQMKGVKTIDEIDFSKLTKAEVDEAADFAMEVTFANNPTSKLGKDALDVFKRLGPIGSSIAPYPRFMFYNMPRWTFNHSPLGLAKIVAPKNIDALLRKGDATRTAKILSEATTGSLMLTAGMLYQQQQDGTARTTELTTPDGGFVDARSFAPIANYLTVLPKMIMDPDQIKPAEIMELVSGLRDVDQSGLGLLANLDQLDSAEKVQERLMEVAGNYIGMFTVPFRQAKDVNSLFDPNERVQRDTQKSPVFGKAIDNIPGKTFSQSLPERRKITEGGTLVSDTPPAQSAVTGVNINYRPEIESALVEAGVQSRNIYPRMGIDEADDYVIDKVGRLADLQGRQILAGDLYQNAKTKGMRKQVLEDQFKAWKVQAVAMMLQERPDLSARVKLNSALSKTERQILEELGVFEGTPLQNDQGLDNLIKSGRVE